MAKKIKVIIKNPGCKPYGTTIAPAEESIRKKLGGEFIRLRYMADGCVLCRKDVSGLDYNCEFLGRDFYGPMIWVGYSEEEILPFPEEFNVFKKLNRGLFEEFERGEKAIRRDTLDLFGLILCFGLWGWLGYEFIRQVAQLL